MAGVGVSEFMIWLESKEEDLRIPTCIGKLLRGEMVGRGLLIKLKFVLLKLRVFFFLYGIVIMFVVEGVGVGRLDLQCGHWFLFSHLLLPQLWHIVSG